MSGLSGGDTQMQISDAPPAEVIGIQVRDLKAQRRRERATLRTRLDRKETEAESIMREIDQLNAQAVRLEAGRDVSPKKKKEAKRIRVRIARRQKQADRLLAESEQIARILGRPTNGAKKKRKRKREAGGIPGSGFDPSGSGVHIRDKRIPISADERELRHTA